MTCLRQYPPLHHWSREWAQTLHHLHLLSFSLSVVWLEYQPHCRSFLESWEFDYRYLSLVSLEIILLYYRHGHVVFIIDMDMFFWLNHFYFYCNNQCKITGLIHWLCFTYCNLKVDGFVSDLSVNHGCLEETTEEKEFLDLSGGILHMRRNKHQFWYHHAHELSSIQKHSGTAGDVCLQLVNF